MDIFIYKTLKSNLILIHNASRYSIIDAQKGHQESWDKLASEIIMYN